MNDPDFATKASDESRLGRGIIQHVCVPLSPGADFHVTHPYLFFVRCSVVPFVPRHQLVQETLEKSPTFGGSPRSPKAGSVSVSPCSIYACAHRRILPSGRKEVSATRHIFLLGWAFNSRGDIAHQAHTSGSGSARLPVVPFAHVRVHWQALPDRSRMRHAVGSRGAEVCDPDHGPTRRDRDAINLFRADMDEF